ncbi:hypothetical protein CC86DRAFT_415385 [Ophiobolus disseminans]|uniref:DUF7918 domain-containing protein n=1 Tax=Ophiobolus disseminans TaxID=1469910 RepID=A0A6A7AJR4_9PLEO|nr:hypothetical protein CC86DRAFT_415385 [Ophiobolus disseminans]
MAVIDGIPGLEVRIVTNERPLFEHEDRDTQVSPKTVERYIEAQSNAEYEIHYSFKKPFPGNRPVSMIVTIDGKDVDEPMIRPFELFDPKGHVSYGPISQQAVGWVVQNYYFSKINIREAAVEAIPEELKKKLQPVGIITCEFYFLNNPRRNTHLHGAQKDIEELHSVSEKAIKGDALSHQTVLSDIKPTEEVEYYDADYADGGEPFATFHFYYRSLAALKDLHIVERTPEPLDILDSDDSVLGQMNREQLEAIVRRFREQEENRIRTKRERSDSVTVVGDEDDIGDRYQHSDPDLLEMRWVDLREQRNKLRVRQLPTAETEVIELD